MKCSFKNKRHHPFRSLMFKGRPLRHSEVLNFTSLARLSPLRPLCLLQFALPSDTPSFSSDFLCPAPSALTPRLVFKLWAKLRLRASLPRLPPEHLSDRVCFAALRDEAATSTPLPIMPLSEPRTASRTSKCTLQRPKSKEKNTARSVKST